MPDDVIAFDELEKADYRDLLRILDERGKEILGLRKVLDEAGVVTIQHAKQKDLFPSDGDLDGESRR